MNSETEQSENVLCTFHFARKDGGSDLSAKICNPLPFLVQLNKVPEPVKVWRCLVTISVDGLTRTKRIETERWLSSFLLALKYIHTFIPEGEECEWIDEEGLEIWCVLPRFVPFSWGYDLYHQISQTTAEMERKYEEDVQRRRLAWEKARGISDG